MRYRRILRGGACLILLALVVRLIGAGLPGNVVQWMQDPAWISFLVYLETGRVIRYPDKQPQPTEQPKPSEAATQPTSPTEPTEGDRIPVFGQLGLDVPAVAYGCDYRPNLESLLYQPLQWDLTDGEPAVLILHTHATECYTGVSQGEYTDYRTLDEAYNMVSLGAELTRLLEAAGIRVIHDTTYHDYPNYNTSYVNARKTVEDWLREYPSIRMVLDLHRDASDGVNGQLVTSATVGGQPSAQLMMVVGTDAGGNTHPQWRSNLSLALKLSAVLEQQNPGIMRPVHLRSERFNMDLTAGSLIVEVGAAGNTRQEALIAVHALAEGVIALAKGSG